MYIYERENWTNFRWDTSQVSLLQEKVFRKQGLLYGRLTTDSHTSFHAYQQLNAQVTRWFRHFSIYIGGENLTGFRQRQTIVDAETPWSSTFDPTLVWGPVHGAMGYIGVRWNINRL